ncbi:hypothetical protein RCH09_003281 [Actimicrobium sp. GrIS 1.19]|uniref:hypothetical protein n=1 Tax=Actimicrobium sp. GrIS 1.19 TaxID=3071708 RepID=UPI002DF9F43C|nr:hypothetical protein [Actimicrobium sp. GrIS 1.19]
MQYLFQSSNEFFTTGYRPGLAAQILIVPEKLPLTILKPLCSLARTVKSGELPMAPIDFQLSVRPF